MAKPNLPKSPISRSEFTRIAKALSVAVDGQVLSASPWEFQSGSFGWRLTQKLTIKVGDREVPVQVSANIAVIGSKNQD